MKTFTLAAALAISAGFAVTATASDFVDTAQVVNVTPIHAQVSSPQTVCGPVAAQPQQKGIAGALIGGAAGGLLGNQVGKGGGKIVATVLGAGAGAYAGNLYQNGSGNAQPQQACSTQTITQDVIRGYSVTYRYGGRLVTGQLPYDPGPTVHVGVGLMP